MTALETLRVTHADKYGPHYPSRALPRNFSQWIKILFNIILLCFQSRHFYLYNISELGIQVTCVLLVGNPQRDRSLPTLKDIK